MPISTQRMKLALSRPKPILQSTSEYPSPHRGEFIVKHTCSLASSTPSFPSCTTLPLLNPKSISQSAFSHLHNFQLDANKSPCTPCPFRCFDLRLVECDCLFRRADARIKIDVAVENRSRLLIHMSLQSLSDCKHDSSTSRARIEQTNLL